MIETNEFTKQGLFSIQRYKTRLILKELEKIIHKFRLQLIILLVNESKEKLFKLKDLQQMRQRRIIYIKIIQVGKFLNSKINLELKYAKPELHLSYKCEKYKF